MLEIGSLIDNKYKILNQVGKGGMSVVYLAMNEKANKQWAVKEVRKDGVMDFESVKQGLIAETDILKKLSNPHLPSIIDVIDKDDSFIIIMDYIQGNSLKQVLDEYGVVPEDQVLEWGKQLCDVLGYLHSQDPPIIYRDMKPANIMLTPAPDNKVVLIDFGTAREFKESSVEDTTCLGTRGYAAPEQYGGHGQTDARTDIYGLGVTMYHLLTGQDPSKPPYEIKPIREINPALSIGLERIIQKCTRQDPNERYQSAAELMHALNNGKMDRKVYINGLKRKLRIFCYSLLLTVVCSGVALWAYSSAESKKKENYDFMLSQASSIKDYYDVIVIDPTRKEAYLGSEKNEGLINFLIKDNKITNEENSYFTKLRTGLASTDGNGYSSSRDVLAEIEKADSDAYHQICYEIGEAILFYCDIGVEKDKYKAAANWFQFAGEKYPIAEVYCDISECLESISKFKKGGQLAKLNEAYENLWSKIKGLNDTANNSKLLNQTEMLDMQLRVWTEIIKMINNNTAELCEVVSKDELIDFIISIYDNSKEINNSFLKDSISDLQHRINETRQKVESGNFTAEEDENA